MSIWCEVTGQIVCRKDAHISIKDIVTSACDESVVKVGTRNHGLDRYLHEVDFRFCAEGMVAAQIMQSVISLVKVMDSSAYIDLTSSIRWF